MGDYGVGLGGLPDNQGHRLAQRQTKANLDVFLKVPANAAIPEHWHTSAERMVLVAGELHVNYKGQAKAVLTPGMYAYGPAKLPHSASCAGGAPCVVFIAFESALDAVPTEAAAK